MKIDDNPTVPKIVKLPANRSVDCPQEKPDHVRDSDRVTFSSQARELLEARRLLAGMPDVREEKVAEVKARIDGGRYRIDSEAIAEKMIRELFPEEK